MSTEPAPRLGASIPLGRLATVVSTPGGAYAEPPRIFGVVLQREPTEVHSTHEADPCDGFPGLLYKGWLLHLEEGRTGALHWEDFIPSCEKCGERMVPFLSTEEVDKPELPCPGCEGKNGEGKCLQLTCTENDNTCSGCEFFPPTLRPAYCGSHPYFGGYRASSRCFKAFGPPLFQSHRPHFQVLNYHVAAFQTRSKVRLDLFHDQQRDPASCGSAVYTPDGVSLRVTVTESERSIIAARPFAACPALSKPVSSAHMMHDYVILLHRYEEPPCLVRSSREKPNEWTDWAELQCEADCRDFRGQVLATGEGSYPSALIGLSERALWVLPLRNIGWFGSLAQAAADLVWKKAMDLPLDEEEEWREEASADEDVFPRRLLAPGPSQRNGEVVIFATKSNTLRPWLYVQLGKSHADPVRTAHLSSFHHVPLKPPEPAEGEPETFSHLLPTVTRIGGRRSGYLFYNQLGQVYHLRDEAIILVGQEWRGPDYRHYHTMNRVVTFRLSEKDEKRFCPLALLVNFPHFKSRLEWDSTYSPEIWVEETDGKTFDQFLNYVLRGKLADDLDLWTLTRLLYLGAKFYMYDFLARTLLALLSLLEDPSAMSWQHPQTMATLMAFADDAPKACPLLRAKVMAAILSCRGDLVRNQHFLEKVSTKSVSSLAQLLSPLAPAPDPGPLRWCPERMQKRRKKEAGIQSNLFRHAGDSPYWSWDRL